MSLVVSRWPRLAFSSGTLEALKWFALVCMVVDHANRVLFDYQLGQGAEFFGRLAFPIFATVFGYNLSRPGADLAGIASRTTLVGAASCFVYMPLLGAWPLNVLFTLSASAAALWLWQRGFRVCCIALVVVAGAFVDYLWPGVGLILAVRSYARNPAAGSGGAILWCIGAIGLLMGNAYAFAAVPLLAIASRFHVDVPRLRWAFLAAYPLHLVALVLLSRV